MSEDTEEAQRRRVVMRGLELVPAGTGHCPGCHQRAEVFARRSARLRPAMEQCLDCWKAERSGEKQDSTWYFSATYSRKALISWPRSNQTFVRANSLQERWDLLRER